MHLVVEAFDCTWLAPVEDNRKTAIREKERTPGMFVSVLSHCVTSKLGFNTSQSGKRILFIDSLQLVSAKQELHTSLVIGCFTLNLTDHSGHASDVFSTS